MNSENEAAGTFSFGGGWSLASFLEAAAHNQAVIPYVVGMETYRGSASAIPRSSFAPLVPYSDRFLFLVILEVIQV